MDKSEKTIETVKSGVDKLRPYFVFMEPNYDVIKLIDQILSVPCDEHKVALSMVLVPLRRLAATIRGIIEITDEKDTCKRAALKNIYDYVTTLERLVCSEIIGDC